MTWVKTDDNAPNHPKFFRAGVAAYGFWHAMLSYCNRWLTDGRVPSRELPLIFPGTEPEKVMEYVEVLVREGLLHVIENGYELHDYLHYQPSRKYVQQIIKERKHAARKGGVNSGKRRQALASTKREVLASTECEAKIELPSRPVPSRPVPTKELLTTLSGEPPDAASLNGKHSYKAEARDVLSWLNEKANKRFEPNDTNLAFIEGRLREGRPAWLLKKLVSVKVKAWGTDEKMREYLRPATLFNRTKCAQYIGELPVGTEPA